VVYTLGFADAQELSEHYEKHCIIGREFPTVASEAEYQDLADLFLGSPLGAHIHECQRRRKDGTSDRIRYNSVTQ